jgi:hypothetical protein
MQPKIRNKSDDSKLGHVKKMMIRAICYGCYYYYYYYYYFPFFFFLQRKTTTDNKRTSAPKKHTHTQHPTPNKCTFTGNKCTTINI